MSIVVDINQFDMPDQTHYRLAVMYTSVQALVLGRGVETLLTADCTGRPRNV